MHWTSLHCVALHSTTRSEDIGQKAVLAGGKFIFFRRHSSKIPLKACAKYSKLISFSFLHKHQKKHSNETPFKRSSGFQLPWAALEVQSSVCPLVRPLVHPSVRPLVRPLVRPSVRPWSVRWSVCRSVRPSVGPSVRRSVGPSVGPSIGPSPL